MDFQSSVIDLQAGVLDTASRALDDATKTGDFVRELISLLRTDLEPRVFDEAVARAMRRSGCVAKDVAGFLVDSDG